MDRLAIILLRGRISLSPDQRRTLDQLRLVRKNHCVVVPKNASFEGMVKVVKDFITWGELSDEVMTELVEKRGEAAGNAKKFVELAGKKVKPVFRLSPPRGGFKGTIRRSVQQKGAAGYRGEKINDLLRKMV